MSGQQDKRVADLLESLAAIASGDLEQRLVISGRHDELDAIAHAINVVIGELQIASEGLRRAKEEAEAANMAKTTFLRNVSHEIRTPLTVILGSAELLATERHSEETVERLHERIASNGRALIGILDDLIDLSKVEAERIDFELQPSPVGELIADVVASFEPEAKRKSLRLFSEQEGDTPKALADPKRLRQILTNLVGNGLKFTTSGHVVVRLKQSTDGERIVIDVTDTGIGMTEAQRRLLFRPFVQADKTIARRFGGSGLGLALSKRFAEGMGGALDVLYSEPGVGTTFRLELPGARAAGEGKSDMARAPEPRRDALRGQRILLVEDNEDVRTMFVEFLRARGATVVEASDGEEAFDRAREMTFDTILMDVRMPHVDGLEATRRLRAQGLTTPIIALTADAVSAQRGECFNAGCDAYLAKPIDLPTLVKQLEEQQFHGKGRNRGGQAGAASRGNASQR